MQTQGPSEEIPLTPEQEANIKRIADEINEGEAYIRANRDEIARVYKEAGIDFNELLDAGLLEHRKTGSGPSDYTLDHSRVGVVSGRVISILAAGAEVVVTNGRIAALDRTSEAFSLDCDVVCVAVARTSVDGGLSSNRLGWILGSTLPKDKEAPKYGEKLNLRFVSNGLPVEAKNSSNSEKTHPLVLHIDVFVLTEPESEPVDSGWTVEGE